MSAMILALAALSAQPEPITVVGSRWAPFISPMGEAFRPQGESDDTLGKWFAQADRNRDGSLDIAEMQADAERYFSVLDADGDGTILPNEIVHYEWEMVPEVQVNRKPRALRGQSTPRRRPNDPNALQGAARYTLLNIPQPVAAADADFDRGISLDEFKAAAAARFQLLDRAGDRQLALTELRALVPAPGAKRPRSKRDERIAVPVPLGD